MVKIESVPDYFKESPTFLEVALVMGRGTKKFFLKHVWLSAGGKGLWMQWSLQQRGGGHCNPLPREEG